MSISRPDPTDNENLEGNRSRFLSAFAGCPSPVASRYNERMQILVVIGFVAVMTLTDLAVPVAPWPALVGGAVVYVLGAYAGSAWVARWGLRRLMRQGHGDLGPGLRRLAGAVRVYLVVGVVALMLAGWGRWLSEGLGAGAVPALDRLLALVPFFAALVCFWWASYPLERALRQRVAGQMVMSGQRGLPVWTRRQHLAFNVRTNLLFIAVPAGAILVVVDLLRWLEPVSEELAAVTALMAGSAMYLAAPAVIVRIWQTAPLPEGPLRDRLEELCRRMKLRYRRLLVWRTGGVIVNAGVMGVVGPVRYVLLSDALLGRFSRPSVEAVFAHEAGHIVHRHIPYMILFTVGLLALVGAGAQAVLGLFGLGGGTLAELVMLVVGGAVWLVLFGVVSRRFERQSDVFAAVAAGGGELNPAGVDIFSRALLDVARYNGIPAGQWNFRHGSIRQRVDYLTGLLAEGRSGRHVDQGVRVMKLGIWLLLAVGLLAAVAAG
jgi:STE24 endopeptidase